jgi:hypothetical protein
LAWTIGRTASIGLLFVRGRARMSSFPRVEDSASFLDEIACEIAAYDDQRRTIKYTHPETQRDDALHALSSAGSLG